MVNLKNAIFGTLLPVFKTEVWYVNPDNLTLEFQLENGIEIPALFLDFLEMNFELCKVQGLMWFGMYLYANISPLEKNDE